MIIHIFIALWLSTYLWLYDYPHIHGFIMSMCYVFAITVLKIWSASPAACLMLWSQDYPQHLACSLTPNLSARLLLHLSAHVLLHLLHHQLWHLSWKWVFSYHTFSMPCQQQVGYVFSYRTFSVICQQRLGHVFSLSTLLPYLVEITFHGSLKLPEGLNVNFVQSVCYCLVSVIRKSKLLTVLL